MAQFGILRKAESTEEHTMLPTIWYAHAHAVKEAQRRAAKDAVDANSIFEGEKVEYVVVELRPFNSFPVIVGEANKLKEAE